MHVPQLSVVCFVHVQWWWLVTTALHISLDWMTQRYAFAFGGKFTIKIEWMPFVFNFYFQLCLSKGVCVSVVCFAWDFPMKRLHSTMRYRNEFSASDYRYCPPLCRINDDRHRKNRGENHPENKYTTTTYIWLSFIQTPNGYRPRFHFRHPLYYL